MEMAARIKKSGGEYEARHRRQDAHCAERPKWNGQRMPQPSKERIAADVRGEHPVAMFEGRGGQAVPEGDQARVGGQVLKGQRFESEERDQGAKLEEPEPHPWRDTRRHGVSSRLPGIVGGRKRSRSVGCRKRHARDDRSRASHLQHICHLQPRSGGPRKPPKIMAAVGHSPDALLRHWATGVTWRGRPPPLRGPPKRRGRMALVVLVKRLMGLVARYRG